MTLRIIVATPAVVVVEKPCGVSVIPGRGEPPGADVKALLARQLGQTVWTVHRLDRDTSGVLVFALDAPTHRALSMALEAGEVEKSYVALVAGVPKVDKWTTTAALVEGRKGRMRTAREGEAGKESATSFEVVERFAAATCVRAFPKTGRTHQIRVHLAHSGFPLLADPKYGLREGDAGFAAGLRRTPLHASSFKFSGKADCAALFAESPTPDDMQAAIEKLRGGLPKR